MRYNYRSGVTKQTRTKKVWVLFPVVALLSGSYLLINSLSPALQLPIFGPEDATAKRLTAAKPNLTENRLYIPQLNVDVAIAEGNTEAALEKGAWHRQPQNGDPTTGGNFVLSAHRFNLGFTPTQTRAKSPFFHIDKVSEGDQIYVDFKGTRYAYEVTKRYTVSPTALEIENRSSDAKLTLYSCDLRGEKAGREVVEAKPIGTIAWVDGNAKLQTRQF